MNLMPWIKLCIKEETAVSLLYLVHVLLHETVLTKDYALQPLTAVADGVGAVF